MKVFSLLALLWLGTTQTVSFSNCCQGIFCSQKDNCPPCGGESKDGRACCESEGSDSNAPRQNEEQVPCIHIEPSSDLVQESFSSTVDAPAVALLPGVPEPEPLFEAPCFRFLVEGADPPARPEGSTPLYLLNRTLLI